MVSLVQPGATYRHDATPRYNVLHPPGKIYRCDTTCPEPSGKIHRHDTTSLPRYILPMPLPMLQQRHNTRGTIATVANIVPTWKVLTFEDTCM